MATLTMVSPGAVTDGVTLIFPEKSDFLAIVLKSDDPLVIVTTLTSHPLRLPSDHFSTVLCKFRHKNFLGKCFQ